MKHLKTYNETVDSVSGEVIGPRASWSRTIIDTLEDVGIVIDSKQWNEPPTRPYNMPYEMAIKRLALSIRCTKSSDVLLSDMMDYLNSFMDQIKGDGIGVLDFKIYFNGILDVCDLYNRTPLMFALYNADEETEKRLLSAHKNASVTRINFTFKKFDDISEYNRDYIKKYKSYFK